MKSFLEVVKPKTDPGVYMCAKFDQASNEKIKNIQSVLGVNNAVVAEKLHTTVVYSRKTVDVFPQDDLNEIAHLVGFELWDTKYGKTVVAKLESPYLNGRFRDVMSLGATYDFDDYKPHVTLAYDSGDVDLDEAVKGLELPVELTIVSEHAESLDLDKSLEDITESK